MKRLLAVMMAIAGMAVVAATPMVSNVTAKQRYPWNGKVDITYTLTGDVTSGLSSDKTPALLLSATNRLAGTSYMASETALSGDTGMAEGAHHVVWDLNAQGLGFTSDDVVFTVTYVEKPKQYCVIDLSAGADVANYPVIYMGEPPSGGFNTDEYKTTKLVLRLIEPGSFMMGGLYAVTLTKPYYCGVFEVTQRQYELVMGRNPSTYKGDMRPVERIHWGMIRCKYVNDYYYASAYNWPNSTNVAPNSFVGKIQARTGLNLDLPTEAQWEYACRAGTTTDYNNGTNYGGNHDKDPNMDQLGRYKGNTSDGKGGCSEHTTVGSYEPNAWGLYDMHGNVVEWCLDWYGSLTNAAATDPEGPEGCSSGTYRVIRGGAWVSQADYCASSSRSRRDPMDSHYSGGFRLVAGAKQLGVLCSGDSAAVAIDSCVNVGPTLDSVILPWDSSWIGDDSGATVVIADNGAEIKRATGAGEFTYTLSGCERHELTYATYVNGVVQDEVYTTTVYTVYAQWKYNVVDGGAVITGTSQKFGATIIPPEIDGYPVTGIAAGAFEGAYWIETVAFPSTLRFVGARAFKDCTGIEEIALPEGVVAVDREAFRNCTYAQNISLPSTLREIGDGAFANCSQLMSVEIPDGVVEIGEVAFSNCWRMLSASIPCSVTKVGVGAFVECRRLTGVTVPLGLAPLAELFPSAYGKIESVVVTAETAAPHSGDATGGTPVSVKPPMVPGLFAGCGAMESLTLPEDLADVSADAFVGCTNMAAFNLPNTVTNIGARAFKDLGQLTEFAFPTGLVFIGEESFAGCAAIGSLSLPEGLQSIGMGTFRDLSLLARADIPGSVTNVGTGAFGGCTRVRTISLPGDAATVATMFPNTYWQITSATVVDTAARSASVPYQMMDGLFEGCSALVAVEMPPSLMAIGARAFKGCSSLTAAGIPAGVSELGEEAFMGCACLSQMALPNGLAVLPSRAFANCSSLTELTVPETVLSLGTNLFSGCSLLRSVRFVGNAPAYDAAVYDGTSSALITYVPNGSMGWDGVPTSRALPEFWPDGTTHEITWWEPNRFLVDFIAAGSAGSVTSKVEQVTGTTYSLPPDPVRRGAVFGGWWTEATGGARVTAVTQVALTRPHTFYAHWTFNRYSVSFDANGGDGTMDAQELTVATAANLSECGFSRVGYAFLGWATEPDGEVAYTNSAEVLDLAYEQGTSVTLYAVWDERDWTLADYVDCDNIVFSNDAAAAWTPDSTTYKTGGASLRSGVIDAAVEGERTNTTLTATVAGAGSGSFWWKVHCEEMDDGFDEWYDYAVFMIDGVEVAKIAGDSGWRQVEYTVTGAGPHVLAWTFSRDDYDEDGATWQNCAWVDGVVWTPTPVTVTFAAGGATVGTVPETVTKYEGYELTLPGAGTLANGTYVFMGWSDGETTYASGTTYVFGSTNTTLAAVWGEKVWTLGEAVDAEMLSFTTGGDADWSADGSTGWTNGVSAKSGTVTSGQSSWIETTVNGAGTLSFRWNVMGGVYRNTPFAFAKVEVDGTQQAQEYRTDGWKEQTATVEGAGAHTIRWIYSRTSSRTADGDCAWLDAVAWTPSGEVDGLSAWLAERHLAADSVAANGRTAAECYVLGLDPADATNDFCIVSIEMVDGQPKVEWEPKTNHWTGVEIQAVLKGAATLDGEWQTVTEENKAGFRFFKVVVEVP